MIEGAERIAAPQAATGRIFVLIHKPPVYQSLIHDHLGAFWHDHLGAQPDTQESFIFPVAVTRYVDIPAG
jgi:hypothetical protein